MAIEPFLYEQIMKAHPVFLLSVYTPDHSLR